ncbi:MAG: S8 family peptidase [Pseudomonadota bacterium]
MKRVVLSTFALLFSGTLAFAQQPSFTAPDEPEIIPGQFIVKLAPGVAATEFDEATLPGDAEIIETLSAVGVVVVQDDSDAIGQLTESVGTDPNVAYVEPVYRVYALGNPNDPSYPPQWGFPKIKAPSAWDKLTDSGKLVIAVIDTGVDYRHPDLFANMWTNPGETPNNGVDDDGNGIIDDVHGANFVPSTPTGDPMDDNQHGTHVAGTIGAVTDNNLGVAGVNWTTKIMGVKFLSANGSGSTAGAIRSIDYAIRMKADIMNNSWGGGGFSQGLKDAIEAADNAGILFVAAAGNAGTNNDTNPHYPSSYDVPNVLAVMATDQNDNRASFSQFGAASVDMGAPGVDILSTTPNSSYASFNGTSMATPHVAGAAALVWAGNPSLSHLDLKKRLMATADVIPALAGTSQTGARLNLAAALGDPDGPGDPGDPGDPAPGPIACKAKNHTQIAYEEFFWSDSLETDENSNILKVDFVLPEPMVVDISTDTSASRVKGAGNTIVRTGVFNQEIPNVMWTGSYRRANFSGGSNVYRDLSSDFSIALGQGAHTIYWKIWVSGATLRFDSGTLTVRGIPCVMGGKLDIASAAATSVDRTQADQGAEPRMERLGSDAEGRSTTSAN